VTLILELLSRAEAFAAISELIIIVTDLRFQSLSMKKKTLSGQGRSQTRTRGGFAHPEKYFAPAPPPNPDEIKPLALKIVIKRKNTKTKF